MKTIESIENIDTKAQVKCDIISRFITQNEDVDEKDKFDRLDESNYPKLIQIIENYFNKLRLTKKRTKTMKTSNKRNRYRNEIKRVVAGKNNIASMKDNNSDNDDDNDDCVSSLSMSAATHPFMPLIPESDSQVSTPKEIHKQTTYMDNQMIHNINYHSIKQKIKKHQIMTLMVVT